MSSQTVAQSTRQGLAFLALLSFVVAFFAARVFTTINPDTVVVSSGIHFHHFWYGLIMVVVAGWLAIASNRPEYDRVFAIVFGLGLGLIGDETGLLLTLGDYHSELTYVVFVAVVSLAVLGIIAARYWPEIRAEVLHIDRGEWTVYIGIAVCALSTLGFAFGFLLPGTVVLALGLAVIGLGTWLHAKRKPQP